MAKSSGRIALYELVNKARFKSAQQKALSRTGLKAEQTPADSPSVHGTPDGGIPKTAESKVKPDIKMDRLWSTRPRAVRLYPDRIELCFSWQVTVIGLLVLVAIFLVFFRLGQICSLKKSEAKKSLPTSIAVEKIMPKPKTVEIASVPNIEQKSPRMVEPMGDHVIVVASYDLSNHLEPAKQYFAEFGIATEIIKKGSRYLLVTQERFDNPDKAGTDGFEMKKKIMSIGAKYKPPGASGFESFGAKPFQDVYGMKVN
jgi:hypothetical protein